jgi:hypothetical protein
MSTRWAYILEIRREVVSRQSVLSVLVLFINGTADSSRRKAE